MNSLYNIYIKRTAVILFVGILFTLLFLYLAFINSVGIDYDNIFDVSNIFSEYASSVFIVNIALTLVLVYGFFASMTKATGLFIKSLPIKSSLDFIAKVLCTLLFICIISAFEYFIFRFITKGLISEAYSEVSYWYGKNNIYLQPLSELYNDFNLTSLWYFLFTLLFSSVVFLLSECIGIAGFSVTLPVIAFFSFTTSLVGSRRFLNDIYNSLPNEKADIITKLIEHISKPSAYIAEYVNPYIAIISITIILYIFAFLCCRHYDFSKAGQLFIFSWAKYITYFFGCIFGGFSFYFIGGSILEPQSIFTSGIILAASVILSFVIINRIEKAFT